LQILRAAAGIAGLLLLCVLVWAGFFQTDLHGAFFDQFAVIATLPWGVASLADLYVGFVLFAILVYLVERSWVAMLLWAAPVFVLGNVWAALWFALKLPEIARRLTANT